MADVRARTGSDGSVAEVVRRPSRLRALAVLEANAESSAQALDRIAAIACRVLDVPIAIVNLVGADRQRFVACGGAEVPSVREMPVNVGFCPFALEAEGAYAFADAREDPALAANPAVEQLGVIAYAGAPLRAADGEPVGTLCVLDHEPHPWSDEALALLADLATSATSELQLLTATRLAYRNEARLRALATLSEALVPATGAGDVAGPVLRALGELGAIAAWRLEPDGSGRTLDSGAEPLGSRPAVPAAVARGGRLELLPTIAAVRDRLPAALEAAPGTEAVAVLPLGPPERRTGVLVACFGGERTFDAGEREYLEAVAGVAGLALARPEDALSA